MIRYSLSIAALLLALSPAHAQSPASNRFEFRHPRRAAYRVEEPTSASAPGAPNPHWIRVCPDDGSTNHVELGDRVVIQVKTASDLEPLLRRTSMQLSRTVATNVFILQAPNAWTALVEAQRLAKDPGVLTSHPVIRKSVALHSAYSPKPNDRYFPNQWYLERRNADGSASGMDLNVREAWPITKGQGSIVAIADGGVELAHPELAPRAVGAPHYNFDDPNSPATPPFGTASWAHATEVAGLAVAEANNGIGMAGVAPGAQLASWLIFMTNGLLVSDEQLMDMYQFKSNIVSVQNHSWGHPSLAQTAPGLLEQIGISNALTFGRDGRGVVMVRAAGNDRSRSANVNDDGYPSDPRVIAVGAARFDGRVASYSEPGACVLVGAPSGDPAPPGFPTLFTTDLLGDRGVNQFHFFGDTNLWDYVFDSLGFSGTSGSAPLVSGVVALMISGNTNLTSRDVQQILIHASRHFDFADPDLTTNGAGFVVSHNLGFGVPNAGVAVALARSWSNRPPLTTVALAATNPAAIPDDALRLLISGDGIPDALASIQTLPAAGLHADVPTAIVPLVDVGLATNPISADLTGKAALIQRGTNNYSDKVAYAAQAGASFAVIYNNAAGNSGCPGGDQLCLIGGTDFTPIPAVFIKQSDGESLRALLQAGTNVQAQLHLNSTNFVFTVTNTLVCEHIAVRVSTDHPLRGDLRITLLSPQGTRSVLQAYNSDSSAGPIDWTYYSTHHFYESSAGDWTLAISDESAGATGTVQSVEVTITGVAITDSDRDGLDDQWEIAHFGSLAYGPKDDPDGDGYSNAREQILGTDPLADDIPFKLDLSPWNPQLARLSWPGATNRIYQVWSSTNVDNFTLLTNVPGKFPITDWFTPYTNTQSRFFQVRRAP